MAELHGKRYGDALHGLKLSPVVPLAGGPHHAYDVAILKNAKVLFERQYICQYQRRFHLGHSLVLKIARAFQYAPDLFTEAVQRGRARSARTEEWRAPECCVTEDVAWLVVVLSGRIVKEEQRVVVSIFLSTEEDLVDDADDRLPCLTALTFTCSPTDAVAFGTTLEAECIAAREGRKDLGVSTWDECDETGAHDDS